VSWQLVSFLILGAGLLAGFAWYERSRPPSQVVAMVAALAALAIAGRIAFAAFPNVKPTTDIVIFSGYALGGAPGFAVGALTALVSNFWFGQGPWTPWQMAGWGLCGLLGAAVALGWRNVGRFGLAAICGLAAVFYGALLNFSLMATYGGDLSWQRFVAYEGSAVPFEIAHAAGNVAFALVAGPAMLRMLVRFRGRFEWSRGAAAGSDDGAGSRRGLHPGLRGGIAALLFVLLVAAAPAPARADGSGNVRRAAEWLVSSQNKDGGWGTSPEADSGAETTCWAMLGLESVGINPRDIVTDPIPFLRRGVSELQHPGDIARTIVALEGAGVDPRDFGGHNLISRLLGKRRKDGSYEDWPGTTAFAVMALRAAGATKSLSETLGWLRSVQNKDGGWGDVPGSPSTSDGTGAVMQVLSAGSKASNRGLAYLRGAQYKGGGFPLGGNGEINSQSTAWAIQGIVAAGADPGSFRRGSVSAPEYLAARQAPDGHYRYSKSSDQTPTWVTGEVLVAAAGKTYPIPSVPREVQPPIKHTNPAESSPATTDSSHGSSSTSGGVPPSTASSSHGSGSGSPSASGKTDQGGAGGTPSGHSAPPATIPLSPGQESSGGASGGGTPGTAPAESSVSSSGEESQPDSGGTTTLGAILTFVLLALLLAGTAWLARKGWMRWRYGL
jgi:energy-coupling factor transport system substrate-specific component